MGEVISISRVSDIDIFSQFDDQCPQIPEDVDALIPRSAHKAVHKTAPVEIGHSFRNHCIIVVVLALLVLAAVKIGTGALINQVSHAKLETKSLDTEHRNNQTSWQAYIRLLEADPIYQRIIEERRLYSIQFPGQ